MTIVVAASTVSAATEVPSKYDVVINGHGYRFAEQESQRAMYGFSPTFVARTNVQGDYGDNQQDFWLTSTQRDWTLGEQQKFFRQDDGRDRRYWQGTNLDVRTPGQVTIRQALKELTAAAAIRAVCPRGAAVNQNLIAASTTNLYEIDAAGAFTDKNAHGLGVAPARYGLTTDGTDIYVSSTAGGTNGVRKWDGSSYSTFSADGADSLEFLNNTLFGLRSSDAKLVKWDTSGTKSDVFQWKQADGGARGGITSRVRAFGGKLVVLWSDGPNGPEVWLYDGTAPALIAALPRNFYAHDIEVVAGIIFVSGSFVKISNGTTTDFLTRPAVYFYASGQIGLLWKANAFLTTASTSLTTASHPALAAFDEGLVFTDDQRGALMFYDLAAGGVHSIGAYTVAGDTPLMAASQRFLAHTRNQTTGYLFPDTTTIATSGTITTSLADFDSSLNKYMKSVVVDADVPTGASIDISYRLEDLDGAFTSIVTGASSGTEYDIGVNGRAIAIRVTLNKGSSAEGPTVKRIHRRASPVLDTFNKRKYVLDLSGRDGKSHIQLRDGTVHAKDGKQMADNLITAAGSTTPITIIDRFETFTGIIEPEGFQLLEIRPDEFVAVVPVREV